MTQSPQLIVWDFDGVLNANMRGGHLSWAATLKADLGLDTASLSAHLNASGRLRDIMRGRRDLNDTVAAWLATQGGSVTAEDLLSYWFQKAALPDAEVLGWLQRHPARHVIGTNNETRRSAYIETQMGYAALVEHVFSSGRMGVAKPDPGFFARIERWAALPPSQILLVDDAPENIAAARKRGWQAFLFSPDTRANLPERLGLTKE
ncbi:putative hydrolase of the HAD superfamily [Sagittula marina]|uniref:Putative hydrolase of the HAD superfamily n=1 Tax=Sagittula marina TaxID=943940 RepID=A0A7W6GSF9_9RHOB|nr:HAD-IA family hydrolase [Sagittula marina]MBB3985925.1 putative hydrolase of the HAD superfamily [Sagittula marina]